MRYRGSSTFSFCLKIAWKSMSVMMPKPSFFNSSTTAFKALSKFRPAVALNPYVSRFMVTPLSWIRLSSTLLHQQHGTGRQDRDRVTDARPIVTGPVRIDPVRSHDDQIGTICDRVVDDFLTSVTVNQRLVNPHLFCDKPFRKFPQAFTRTVLEAVVKGLEVVELNMLNRLNDVQQNNFRFGLLCKV